MLWFQNLHIKVKNFYKTCNNHVQSLLIFQVKAELNYFKLRFVPKAKLTLPNVWNIFRIGQL